jgi:hypothetical protein
MNDGSKIEDELAVADAHPLGARPFARPQYIAKFRTLAEGVIAAAEQDRFLGAVERLAKLKPDDLGDRAGDDGHGRRHLLGDHRRDRRIAGPKARRRQ